MDPQRKLIEVALPLAAINAASSREKAIPRGHPATLHLWWARRPLAACRAVLFASLVDDPSSDPERFPTPESRHAERTRLFELMEQLVRWDQSGNERLLDEANKLIGASTGGRPPVVLDPFSGGGSIPLEAQRLGLSALARDLNPVAVLIGKALIEIPPRFADRPPVRPSDRLVEDEAHRGAEGLAADVEYYGRRLFELVRERVGHVYPPVTGTSNGHRGDALTPVAWIWARTCRCPNPACGRRMPLLNSYVLARRRAESIWVEPDGTNGDLRFRVARGATPPTGNTVSRTGARCIHCETPVELAEVRAQGRAGRIDVMPLCAVAEGDRGRLYVELEPGGSDGPSGDDDYLPATGLPERALGFSVQGYGFTEHRQLFTDRQRHVLSEFMGSIGEVRDLVRADAVAAGLEPDAGRLADGGTGADGYADAVSTYLALSVTRLANRNSSQCFWNPTGEKVEQVFARNALPMVWVFAEANPFSNSSGNYLGQLQYLTEALRRLPARPPGSSEQQDARNLSADGQVCVCTDPPYYDNVPYADLSDFFYVWLREGLADIHPELFGTLLVPKADELIAEPARHAGRAAANVFFEDGLRESFERMRDIQDPSVPLTLFYAFRQAERREEADGPAIASTGWEAMLQALVDAGFAITATWPIRTEKTGGLRELGRNALASSVVLACRPRPADAPKASRRDFLRALRSELGDAIRTMQHGNIAPVDLAQAAVGPGMAVYSRNAVVLEPTGEPMRVGTALGLINAALDELLEQQEGDFDPKTRWAAAWFAQHGFGEGPYGDAELLSKAKATSVRSLVDEGMLRASAGKVSLVGRDELDPARSRRDGGPPPIWTLAHALVATLEHDGESGAAKLLSELAGDHEVAKELAYRLFSISERRGWAELGLGYNALVKSWPELLRLAGGPS